ncbi:MAG TPA: cyclic pyranopterin monophosphate synthase MoaC [Nitrospirota bacterium]|nr:cyclic pyranopterin monophosphate synthase MoaC [Nitrospirota bacterium]
MKKLTHFDEEGAARMVDVSGKQETTREAVAAGSVTMMPETLKLILDRKISKGDVFAVARVAGIMAAKRTAEIIPLCHTLGLTSAEIAFEPDEASLRVNITAIVRSSGRTGVEMEALTAVAAAGLTIYDMCKAVDRAMTVTDIRLMKKTGGKSGTFERPRDP